MIIIIIIGVDYVRKVINSLLLGVAIPEELGLRDFFYFVPTPFLPYSLVSACLRVFILFRIYFSHAQVVGRTLVHEFHIF